MLKYIMRLLKSFITILLIYLFFISIINPIAAQSNKPLYLEGKITQIQKVEVKVQVEEGKIKGKIVTVRLADDKQQERQNLKTGDKVIISYSQDAKGAEIVYIVDHVRRNQLLLLFIIFIAVVIVIGRFKGFFSFLGMIFSFVIIGRMIVPNIIEGTDPVVVTLLGSLFIIPVTFYISHGLNKKTTVAVVSTFISLMLTGILAYVFVEITKLTGFAAEEAVYLQAFKGDVINIKSLLLAGIIIGAMGVLDDITISQASIVEKLYETNTKLKSRELFLKGMDVGRDHIASLVNTLVLVYAGAALPLFLLFYQTDMTYAKVINQEIIATEIVRTLVSSIGIIAAVPITTMLTAIVVKSK